MKVPNHFKILFALYIVVFFSAVSIYVGFLFVGNNFFTAVVYTPEPPVDTTPPVTTPPYRPVYTPPETLTPVDTPPLILQDVSNPLLFLFDGDDDNFPYPVEFAEETDDNNPDLHPLDENSNGVNDLWEEKYSLTVADGMQDTDGDGLSDKLEYYYGTNPLKADTDNDGFSDVQEIFEFQSSAVDPTDPIVSGKIVPRITSFHPNQLVAEPRPLVKGIAQQGMTLDILVRDEKGVEKVLGQTVTHENYVFLFEVPDPLEDGEYTFSIRTVLESASAFNKAYATFAQQAGSAPVTIQIQKALDVVSPDPKKLGDQVITNENILKSVRVIIRDNKPILVGKAGFKDEVIATWHSVVLTSVLIADSTAGEFSMQASQSFAPGDHEIYLQAVRPKDGALSKTIKIVFTIPAEEVSNTQQQTQTQTQVKTDGQVPLKAAPESGVPSQGPLGPYTWWILGIIAGILILSEVYFVVKKKKKGPPEDDTKPVF